MATRTISNAGGNWDAVGTWTEGAVPTNADAVVATSSSGDVAINTTAACASFNMTNYTGNITFTSGSLTVGYTAKTTYQFLLVATMTFSTSIPVIFKPGGTTTVINVTLNGLSLGSVDMQGTANTSKTQLADAFNCGAFTLTKGVFDTQNNDFAIDSFTSSNANTRVLTLGSSSVNIAGTGAIWTIASGTFTLTANTANMTILSVSGAKTFAGGGKTYYNLTINGNAEVYEWPPSTIVITFSGDNTFNNVEILGTSGIKFTAGSTTTISGTLTFGDEGGEIYKIYSSTPGTAYTLSKSSGTVTGFHCFISDCTASGGATWNALTSCEDQGHNSGWNFPSFKISATLV